MTRRTRWIAGVSVIALALPASAAALTRATIGTAPTAPEQNSTKPKLQLLGTALASLNGATTHRVRLDGTVGVTFSQPGSRLNVSLSDDFAAIMQVAAPTSATLSLADASIGKILSAITLNGSAWVSDDRRGYVRVSRADAGTIASWIAPKSQIIRPNDLTGITNVREIADGVNGAIHFRADLSGNYLRTLVRSLTVDPARPTSGPDLVGAFTYETGTIDVFVSPDGRLIKESLSVEANLLPGKSGLMWSAFELRIGAARLQLKATFTPYDLGEPVQIVTPYTAPADARLAGDMQALSLLFQSSMAADTYAQVVGDYSGMTIKALHRIEPSITFIRRGVARASASQVKLGKVQPKRVVLSTLTPAKRLFILNQPLNGYPDIICRTPKGKVCQGGVFARIGAKLRSIASAAIQRRIERTLQ